MLADSWAKFKLDIEALDRHDQPSVYSTDYWTNSYEILTEIDIGKKRKWVELMSDEEFIKRFKEKYKLKDNVGIIYTDASKIKENISTGIGIVIDGEEIGYNSSIDIKCSVFTGELIAIEKALGYILENDWDKDVLILSDSQAAIKNCKLSFYKSETTCIS